MPNLEMFTHEEHKLVQRVFLLPGVAAPKVIVFAGVDVGNGSSSLCASAGQALAAQVGKPICVVDGNLRSPRLHDFFGGDNLRGFSECVSQSGPIRSFARQCKGSNLWVLTSGFHVAEPQALLNSGRLRQRINELSAEFDYVLIDAPALSACSDASLLGQSADGIVLVIEANATRRETALKCKEALESANIKILGAVLNNRTFPIPEAIYRRL